MGQPTFTQVTHRIRDDDGNETGATWLATQGSDYTWDVEAKTNIRVRFLIDEQAVKAWSSLTFNVYYSLNSGTYTLIDGTTPIQIATSSYYSNNADCTSQLTGGSGSFVTDNNGMQSGANAPVNSGNSGDYFEVEICLTADAAQLSNGNTLDLRVYNSTSALNAYTDTPRLTVSGITPPPGYTINSDGGLGGFQSGFGGPFQDGNGNLYIVSTIFTGPHPLRVWKSTNNGQNWTAQDTTNQPTTGSTAGFDVFQDGTTLHIAQFDASTLTVYYHQFFTSDDGTSPDSYGTTEKTVADYTDTGSEYGITILVQSDGDIWIQSNGDDSTYYSTMECVEYHYSQDGGDTWSTKHELVGLNGDCICQTAALGASNKIHAFNKADSAGNFNHASLADVTSTPSSLENASNGVTLDSGNYWHSKHAVYIDDSGDEKLFFGFVASGNTPYATIVTNDGTPGTPTQITTQTVHVSTGAYTGTPHCAAMCLTKYGSDVYAVFVDNSTKDIYMSKWVSGSGWDTPTEIANNITADYVIANTYVRSGTLYLGFVWLAGTWESPSGLYFYEYSLGSVSTTVTINPAEVTSASTIDASDIDKNTTVAPTEVTSASTIDQAVISKLVSIAPDEVTSASSIDATTIDKTVVVAPDAIDSASSIDASEIDIVAGITPDPIDSASSIDPSTITKTVTITPDEVTSASSIDPTDISKQVLLSPDEVTAATTIDASDIAKTSIIQPDEVTSSVSVEPSAIIGHFVINPSEITDPSTIDTSEIDIVAGITPEELTSASSIDASDISTTITIDPEGVTAASTIDQSDIDIHTTVNPDEVTSASFIDVTDIDKTTPIVPEDVGAGSIIDQAVVTKTVTITPDEVTSASSIDATDIDKVISIAPDEITSASSIDASLVNRTASVIPDEVTAASSIDPSEIDIVALITPDALDLATTVDATTVNTDKTLVGEDVTSQSSIDEPIISGVFAIAPEDIGAATTINEPTITKTVTIEPEDVSSTTTIDASDISGVYVITPAELGVGSSIDASDITVHPPTGITISPDSLSLATTVEASQIAKTTTINPDDVTAASTVENVDLVGTFSLEPDELTSTSTIDATIVSTGILLEPDKLILASTIEEPAITKTALISPDYLLSATLLDATSLSILAVVYPDNLLVQTSIIYVIEIPPVWLKVVKVAPVIDVSTNIPSVDVDIDAPSIEVKDLL